ncbi:hypothetical protein KUV85_00060 [Nocardioides panacisoli]|uniref:hypothetical protein n=1 Tax=Nocardioides panacisoli TaxID=627624 RepID=UPI001C632375|nr:hypothetical protein [Nocardioides panacisoli]QYJ04107.1 hypothetical protein KUV85_00060 [Nocardioides panacisoli]
MQPVDVYCNRPFSVGFILLGLLMLALELSAQSWVGVAAGTVVVVLGVVSRVNPILRVTHDEAQVRSPIGIVTKRFPVASPQDLTFEGNVLRHVSGRKVITLGFAADKEQVAALRAQVGSSQRGRR